MKKTTKTLKKCGTFKVGCTKIVIKTYNCYKTRGLEFQKQKHIVCFLVIAYRKKNTPKQKYKKIKFKIRDVEKHNPADFKIRTPFFTFCFLGL